MFSHLKEFLAAALLLAAVGVAAYTVHRHYAVVESAATACSTIQQTCIGRGVAVERCANLCKLN